MGLDSQSLSSRIKEFREYLLSQEKIHIEAMMNGQQGSLGGAGSDFHKGAYTHLNDARHKFDDMFTYHGE